LEPEGGEEPTYDEAPDGALQAARRVIEWPRECPEWLPWTEGDSPKEHRERRDVLRLEQDRRELQVRLADMERDSRESSEKIAADSLKIAEATQATMAGLKDIADRTDQFTTRWTRIAVIIGVAALVAVVMTYLFPDLGRHIGEWIDRSLGYPFGRATP
jgi:hypothetical protein